MSLYVRPAREREKEKENYYYTIKMSPSKCKIKLKEKKKGHNYIILYRLETMARHRRKTSAIIIDAICNGV